MKISCSICTNTIKQNENKKQHFITEREREERKRERKRKRESKRKRKRSRKRKRDRERDRGRFVWHECFIIKKVFTLSSFAFI